MWGHGIGRRVRGRITVWVALRFRLNFGVKVKGGIRIAPGLACVRPGEVRVGQG